MSQGLIHDHLERFGAEKSLNNSTAVTGHSAKRKIIFHAAKFNGIVFIHGRKVGMATAPSMPP